MNQATENKGSRVDRILDAHPDIRSVQAHALLVAHYDKVSKDPTTGGPDGIQLQMEAYTDIITRMDDHHIKNEIAKCSEKWAVSWDELECIMELEEDED